MKHNKSKENLDERTARNFQTVIERLKSSDNIHFNNPIWHTEINISQTSFVYKKRDKEYQYWRSIYEYLEISYKHIEDLDSYKVVRYVYSFRETAAQVKVRIDNLGPQVRWYQDSDVDKSVYKDTITLQEALNLFFRMIHSLDIREL